MTFDDVKQALKSDWLKLTMILVAVVGGWYKFDYRISVLEANDRERAGQVQHVSDVLEKLDSTLDRINQTMRDFPPHRHINDDDVMYPGDAEIHDGNKHR
jgi:hypothetical protein